MRSVLFLHGNHAHGIHFVVKYSHFFLHSFSGRAPNPVILKIIVSLSPRYRCEFQVAYSAWMRKITNYVGRISQQSFAQNYGSYTRIITFFTHFFLARHYSFVYKRLHGLVIKIMLIRFTQLLRLDREGRQETRCSSNVICS